MAIPDLSHSNVPLAVQLGLLSCWKVKLCATLKYFSYMVHGELQTGTNSFPVNRVSDLRICIYADMVGFKADKLVEEIDSSGFYLGALF